MKTSLTFQQGDLKVLLENERNQISARFKESISIEFTGHPVYNFLLKDMNLGYNELSDGRSIPFVIKKAVKYLPEELKETIFQSEDYRLLIAEIRTGAREDMIGFNNYLNELSFKYERDPNVKINNKIRYRLYTSSDDRTKISVTFVKKTNRKYWVNFGIIYKQNGIKKLLTAGYVRETAVSSVEILNKQIEHWLDRFAITNNIPSDDFNKIKLPSLIIISSSEEVFSEILERFNNGWEI